MRTIAPTSGTESSLSNSGKAPATIYLLTQVRGVLEEVCSLMNERGLDKVSDTDMSLWFFLPDPDTIIGADSLDPEILGKRIAENRKGLFCFISPGGYSCTFTRTPPFPQFKAEPREARSALGSYHDLHAKILRTMEEAAALVRYP